MKKLKIKAKNFNKKKSAKIQKRKQKVKTKVKIEYKEDYYDDIIYSTPKKRPKRSFKTNKTFRDLLCTSMVEMFKSYTDNINYVSSYIATNEPLKMKGIFDNDLNLLNKQKINISYLKDLINVFYLTFGIKYIHEDIGENFYNRIYAIAQDAEIQEIKDEYKDDMKSNSDKEFALTAVKYLYNMLTSAVDISSIISANASIPIKVPTWAEDIYKYCQKSHAWKKIEFGY